MPELSPSQRLLVKRRTAPPDRDPGEGGELNIVPFLDILVNLLVVLLVLAASVLAVGQVDAQLPTYGPGDAKGALDLHVALTERGVIVSSSGGSLAPGCEETSSGEVVTVPRQGDDWRWGALTQCAARIERRWTDAGEVTLTAEPTVPYRDVIAAMDALRSDGPRVLFPDVLISAGVR